MNKNLRDIWMGHIMYLHKGEIMRPRGMTVKNRIGSRIGRLIVIERAANKAEGDAIRACWVCRCDCGNTVILTGHTLSKGLRGQGGTRSCGCMLGEHSLKHGKVDTRIYRIWNSMRQRCSNPKNPAYSRYGARGITVCERWRTSFPAFYSDMGDPQSGYSLDRVNNDGNYEPTNCRWASRLEQANNRSTNTLLTLHGKKQTLAQWALALGLSTQCIRSRIAAGWTVDDALTTPSMRNVLIKKLTTN